MKTRATFVCRSFLLTFVLLQNVYGQHAATPERGYCDLTATQLADFRGLRLGMKESKVRKLFAPSSKYRKSKNYHGTTQHLQLCVLGCGNVFDAECQAAAPERFTGLASIHFVLAQKRVELLTFYFTPEAMPADAREFAAAISAALGVPNLWRGDQHVTTLQCEGVRLRIEGQGENKLALIATPILYP
jgi:hypothetical protein